MINAYMKEPSKDAVSVSFLTEDEFNSFVKKHLGKKVRVLIPNEKMQIIIDETAFYDSKKSSVPNVFVRMSDTDTIEKLVGNVVITCIVDNNGSVKSDDSFKEEYDKMMSEQGSYFEQWFMQN